MLTISVYVTEGDNQIGIEAALGTPKDATERIQSLSGNGTSPTVLESVVVSGPLGTLIATLEEVGVPAKEAITGLFTEWMKEGFAGSPEIDVLGPAFERRDAIVVANSGVCHATDVIRSLILACREEPTSFYFIVDRFAATAATVGQKLKENYPNHVLPES